jgi:hypothetical protein
MKKKKKKLEKYFKRRLGLRELLQRKTNVFLQEKSNSLFAFEKISIFLN